MMALRKEKKIILERFEYHEYFRDPSCALNWDEKKSLTQELAEFRKSCFMENSSIVYGIMLHLTKSEDYEGEVKIDFYLKNPVRGFHLDFEGTAIKSYKVNS